MTAMEDRVTGSDPRQQRALLRGSGYKERPNVRQSGRGVTGYLAALCCVRGDGWREARASSWVLQGTLHGPRYFAGILFEREAGSLEWRNRAEAI